LRLSPDRGSNYPGFDVLAQSDHWDPATRRVVGDRLRDRWDRRFFIEAEQPVCRALLACLVPQTRQPEIPVFEMIDERLAGGVAMGDGYRYADMPEDAAAWRRSIAELQNLGFAGLGRQGQRMMLDEIRRSQSFAGMPAPRLWSLWLRYACTAYYSHPWAWNEIGFGGPAYPRGYRNLGVGRREPWEVRERRPRDPVPVTRRSDERQAG
jgi:hypothetical protein